MLSYRAAAFVEVHALRGAQVSSPPGRVRVHWDAASHHFFGDVSESIDSVVVGDAIDSIDVM